MGGCEPKYTVVHVHAQATHTHTHTHTHAHTRAHTHTLVRTHTHTHTHTRAHTHTQHTCTHHFSIVLPIYNDVHTLSVIAIDCFCFYQVVTVFSPHCRGFSNAVFDIFNCNEVHIDSSTFADNTGQGLVDAPNRGNTGAVSIGYYNLSSTVIPPLLVTVTDSNFINNIANVSNTLKATSTSVLNSRSYKGRGAGMGIFMGDSNNRISARIEGCTFQNNTSLRSGAGLYFAFDGEKVNHIATVSQSHFEDNNSGGRGGGIILAFLTSGNPKAPMMARIVDCEFVGNNASSGGGVGVIPADVTTGAGVNVVLENCTFNRNSAAGFGGALRFAVFNTFSERVSIPDHQVINW